MKFVIEGSQKKLREEVEGKIRDGWEKYGEMIIVRPEPGSDIEFVRFWRTMIKVTTD